MQALDPVTMIRNTFPDAVLDVVNFRGETTVVIDSEKIVDVARFCRDTEGLEFNLLSDISYVDYYPREPRFALCYHMYSILNNQRLRLKVYLPSEDPHAPTVTGVWPGANWPEREAWDMMGIRFDGHPDLRRILNPVDWVGHPLRKDYPLGYEQVQFTFNFDEVMKQKPHATE